MIEYFYNTIEYRGREITVCVALAMQSKGEYCICREEGGFYPIHLHSAWRTGNLEQDVLAHKQERCAEIDREHELVELDSVNREALTRLNFKTWV